MSKPVVTKDLVAAFVKRILEVVPAKSDQSLKMFITKQRSNAGGKPGPDDIHRGCYPVHHWFFCLRRYDDVALKQSYLEIWVGTANAFWGYVRLNPYFYDDERKNRKIWELTHAFAHQKYRGQGINRLYVALALELARTNLADLLVANPRHVSMLITLNDMGFKIKGEGGSQHSIKRIIKQGRSWYGTDANARRLYYAQELRAFMTDGSMMMEKDIANERFWKIF